jgi:hypothetical protein
MVTMPCATFFNTCLSPVSRSSNGLNIQAWECMASTALESALSLEWASVGCVSSPPFEKARIDRRCKALTAHH